MNSTEIYNKIFTHEPTLIRLFSSAVENVKNKSFPSILEIGCGEAFYSAYFREKVGNKAKNIMVEPVIEYWQKFGESYFKNKSNCYFYNAYISNIVWAGWGGENDPKVLDIKSKVPEIDLETILSESKTDFIDILHMDMQGSEYFVLKYLLDSGLINSMNYVFIMTHEFGSINYESYLSLLDGIKDKIVFSDPTHKEFGDGLIVLRMC